MLSRKQFLKDILISGVKALATSGEVSEENCMCKESDFLKFTELSSSLLKIEAERLEIDPAGFDEEELRSEVYAALSQQCHRQYESSS